jgi:hypothetical protein
MSAVSKRAPEYLRKRVTVRVEFRVDGKLGEFVVSSWLCRSPVRELRKRSCL